MPIAKKPLKTLFEAMFHGKHSMRTPATALGLETAQCACLDAYDATSTRTGALQADSPFRLPARMRTQTKPGLRPVMVKVCTA